MDCSLDDIVMRYFKKIRCEKTSKMFGSERSSESDYSKSLKKFMKFLKQTEVKKENRVEDDLGFEINFEAFQPEQKVSFKTKVSIIWDPDFHKSSHLFFQGIPRFW